MREVAPTGATSRATTARERTDSKVVTCPFGGHGPGEVVAQLRGETQLRRTIASVDLTGCARKGA